MAYALPKNLQLLNSTCPAGFSTRLSEAHAGHAATPSTNSRLHIRRELTLPASEKGQDQLDE